MRKVFARALLKVPSRHLLSETLKNLSEDGRQRGVVIREIEKQQKNEGAVLVLECENNMNLDGIMPLTNCNNFSPFSFHPEGSLSFILHSYPSTRADSLTSYIN